MATVNINGQSYEVDEEVADQFSKFIRNANKNKKRIEELESRLSELPIVFIPNLEHLIIKKKHKKKIND